MARSNWRVLDREARTTLMVEAGGGWRGEEREECKRVEVAAEKLPAARWLRIQDSVRDQEGPRAGMEDGEREKF